MENRRKNGVLEAIRMAAVTHRLLTAGTVLCAAASVAASLVPPLLLARIIDGLTAGLPLTFPAVLLYFGSLALEGMLSSAQESLLVLFGQKMTHALRAEMSRKLTKLPASTLAGQNPGEVAARFSGDVDTVEALFTSGIISMVADACRILSIMAVIAVKNTGLALILLLVLPLFAAFTRHVQTRMLAAQLDNRRAVAAVSYNEIIKGLKTVAERGIEITSIGIDTWGCDFVCIGDDGQPLRNPLAYRDPHTMGMMERYFEEKISRAEVYQRTGIQFMNFNSLFQLYTMGEMGNVALRNAKKILFMPDALSYMLTGNAICEYTVASTSEMLNPTTGDLDERLLESIGLKREQFGTLTHPGTIIGTINEAVQKQTGLGAVPVIAVAGHDTASAVAAVPAKDEEFAYLSSGTWSLMGIESKKAIINDRSYELNFTNEGGVGGTTRFLKNICGMWLYERCRQEWSELRHLGHLELQKEAWEIEDNESFIFPDDPCFTNPDSMVATIQQYCRDHGMPVPETHGQIIRCIFDSLARRYSEVLGYLREFSETDIKVLHIIGGGSKNDFLNQLTADACGITVLAGPQEGTALGNVMLQAKAAGEVDDIWQMRHIIANSVEIKKYEPKK